MTVTTDTPYREIGDVTQEQWHDRLKSLESPFLPVADAIYEAAKPHSALCLAMGVVENRWGSTGIYIKPHHNNPLSLRPPTGGEADLTLPGVTGFIRTPDTGMFLQFDHPASCIREWKRRLFDEATTYKGGVYGRATTLGQMIAVYAPPGDVHGATGVDNKDIQYAETVARHINGYDRIESGRPSHGGTGGVSGEGGTMQHHQQHKYILSMGHRNTTRGGAAGEIDWTPGATRHLAAALREVGATVYIVHEHDGDTDPNFTNRPLGAIGQIASQINQQHGPCNAYLSMHYGAEPARGFFFIVPDAGNLKHAGTGQVITNDAWASNALDVTMARNIAAALAATNTIPPRTGLREPGIMSERQSGVGLSGWRLAELQESMPMKSTTTRLILEAGNNSHAGDRAFIHNPSWIREVYCAAILKGLEATFGAFPNTAPEKEEDQPSPAVALPNIPDWVREMSEGRRLYHRLDTGELFHTVNRMYRTKGEVPRRQYAIRTSNVVGDPVPGGTVFMLAAVGENHQKEPVGISPWGTRFFMDDLELVIATDTPDQ